MSKAKEVSRVVSSSISKSSETCWMCWKSDMLPPAPMTVYEPMGCIYCMSLKRASEPYEAERRKTQSAETIQNSAVLTKIISRHDNPILVLESSTLVPVTIGSLATDIASAQL